MKKIINESTEHEINKGAELLWDFYSKKFDLYKNISEKKIIIFALNFIHDFLSGNLWNPALLANYFYSNKNLKNFTNSNFSKKHQKLDSLLFEIMDIGWMKEVLPKKEYTEYLNELKERLKTLIEYYESYFANEE